MKDESLRFSLIPPITSLQKAGNAMKAHWSGGCGQWVAGWFFILHPSSSILQEDRSFKSMGFWRLVSKLQRASGGCLGTRSR